VVLPTQKPQTQKSGLDVGVDAAEGTRVVARCGAPVLLAHGDALDFRIPAVGRVAEHDGDIHLGVARSEDADLLRGRDKVLCLDAGRGDHDRSSQGGALVGRGGRGIGTRGVTRDELTNEERSGVDTDILEVEVNCAEAVVETESVTAQCGGVGTEAEVG